MAPKVEEEATCDICGDGCGCKGLIHCSNKPYGCPFVRHSWCHIEGKGGLNEKSFLCQYCTSNQEEFRKKEGQRPQFGLQKTQQNGRRLMMSGPNGSSVVDVKPAKHFNFSSGAATAKGGSVGQPQSGQKRPGESVPESSRPATKPRLEPSGAGGNVDLFKSTMQGLQKEQQRRKATRSEPQLPSHAHASESRSEQRLKRRRGPKPKPLQLDAMRQSQQQIIAASLKDQSIWSGTLQMQPDNSQETVSIDVVAYGISGNPHSMDAALRLPRGILTGSLLDVVDTLEMTSVEASENACLVFRGADDDSQQSLSQLRKQQFGSEQKLMQVLLGENKPLWVALIPAPGEAFFGVFVKFDELWVHSIVEPSKGLLKKAKGRPRRKVEWPDGQESMRRSTDCERGRGNDYGHLRIERKLSETQMDDEDEEEDEEAKTNSMEASAAEAVPHPGPLSDLSVALVGFQRDHEEIRRLRRDLTAAGAQTFTAPWPGCVRILVFPEQLLAMDLALENGAPKELQPLKDFLAVPGTRIFLRIDYPRLCCQLGRMPTPEEEARHNLKELWPEGVVLTADAASLHAASIQPGNRGRASLLEEVLDELRLAASCARRPGTVWMVTATAQHLRELQIMNSPAFRLLNKWQPTKRFSPVDPERATSDLVLTALKLAHFYRFFCRYTVVLVRSEDKELITTADARKTILCFSFDETISFLQSLRKSI